MRRVFALLLQETEQPCVLCGVRGTVRPISPCAYLMCRNCWDMGNYSGCPLCHRRCGFFLVPEKPATDLKVPLPRRAAVLEIAEDVTAREAWLGLAFTVWRYPAAVGGRGGPLYLTVLALLLLGYAFATWRVTRLSGAGVRWGTRFGIASAAVAAFASLPYGLWPLAHAALWGYRFCSPWRP